MSWVLWSLWTQFCRGRHWGWKAGVFSPHKGRHLSTQGQNPKQWYSSVYHRVAADVPTHRLSDYPNTLSMVLAHAILARPILKTQLALIWIYFLYFNQVSQMFMDVSLQPSRPQTMPGSQARDQSPPIAMYTAGSSPSLVSSRCSLSSWAGLRCWLMSISI